MEKKIININLYKSEFSFKNSSKRFIPLSSQMKKTSSNSQKSNKLNLNISLISFKILTIIYSYFLLCYYLGNIGNNKFNNINKAMKHAILLLSSYGINYMNNALSQFNNDKRFDIYIHIDGQSKIDIENNKTITKSNIKYIKHLYKSKKKSIEMVDIMFKLLSIANKTDNYAYFHYFSDSCYLITTLDEFYQFFIENNNKTYINYYLERNFLYKNSRYTLYKGSQWMSLHSNIVHKLLDNIILFNKYKEAIRNRTIRLITGAPDELIITHIIVNDICKRKPKEYNVFNNNLRFIRWKNCRRVHCPNYLDIDNVSEEEIKSIKKNNFLAIRKIDYKNYKAIDLVNKLKGE